MKVKIILTALFSFFVALTFAQVNMPAPSPVQIIKQDFAMGNIELVYSRPAARNRTVFGNLVPYGVIWRTGANAATKIRFSEPVEIKGNKIDSGTYVIYTIPTSDSWEVIINKGLKNWGTSGYKESEDVARFKVETHKVKNPTENFTMQFDNIQPESCVLQITWQNVRVEIPITANIKEKLKAQLDNEFKKDKKPNWQAAQFYYEFDKNNTRALEYVNNAIADNPKAYWIYLYKAKIQKDLGDMAGARMSSQKSLELATEDKNEDYIKLNKDLQKKLK